MEIVKQNGERTLLLILGAAPDSAFTEDSGRGRNDRLHITQRQRALIVLRKPVYECISVVLMGRVYEVIFSIEHAARVQNLW